MGANLTKVFVVDIEATCWETKEEQGNKPNEVIEIGIVELNIKTGGIITRGESAGSYVIKPRFTEVSPFCTALTGWTPEQINKGVDILTALRQIKEDYQCTKNHVWFSFGEYDRIKLSSDGGQASLGGLYGIKWYDNPFEEMRAHYNAKTLMALKEKLPRELGMAKALEYYGETLEGKHHNGRDDALNIAKIVKRVLAN